MRGRGVREARRVRVEYLAAKARRQKMKNGAEEHPDVIELGAVSEETKGGVEHMVEDRDPLM